MATMNHFSGIRKIDAGLEIILNKPKKVLKIVSKLDELPKKGDKVPDISVVGAGFHFGVFATALAAAGATVTAYEMKREQIGTGHRGLMEEDQYLSIGDASTSPRLIPDLTPEHLKQLPPFISTIANDSKYLHLMRKSESAEEILEEMKTKNATFRQVVEKYDALPSSEKILTKEIVEMNEFVIDTLQNAGVLTIKHQEVTFEMVNQWLGDNKPVFMASGGSQATLAKINGHIRDTDGFLEDFSKGSKKTDAMIKSICSQQLQFEKKDGQQANRPTVAISGGSEKALACAKSLLENVRPGLLQVVWIGPELINDLEMVPKSLAKARASMGYQSIIGYISDMTLSKEEPTITSLQVDKFLSPETIHVQPDLFVHSCDEIMSQKATSVRDCITALINDRKPVNGILRYRNIIPYCSYAEIPLRIVEPWTASLHDDDELKSKIQNLVEKSNHESTTILINGDNNMCDRLVILAESLGYTGRLIQVNPHKMLGMFTEQKRKAIEEGCGWENVAGVLEETHYANGQYQLDVRSSEEKTQHLSNIGFFISPNEKNRNTPLIERMKQHGYISETFMKPFNSLHTKHPALFGYSGIFADITDQDLDIESPSIRFTPHCGLKWRDPNGWDNYFLWAVNMSM